MSHDLACDFLTPTMQSLDVGCVCILVSEEGVRNGKAAKKKHRVRTPDDYGSGSEEEPLQKIVERNLDDENRSLQAHRNEALRKKSAQMRTGAGSSGSSLISEPTNKKPSAIVSPSKRKLSTDDPEIG